jgi:hypothetical protein
MRKKLHLGTETLRVLSDSQARRVVGGTGASEIGENCETCPTCYCSQSDCISVCPTDCGCPAESDRCEEDGQNRQPTGGNCYIYRAPTDNGTFNCVEVSNTCGYA